MSVISKIMLLSNEQNVKICGFICGFSYMILNENSSRIIASCELDRIKYNVAVKFPFIDLSISLFYGAMLSTTSYYIYKNIPDKISVIVPILLCLSSSYTMCKKLIDFIYPYCCKKA